MYQYEENLFIMQYHVFMYQYKKDLFIMQYHVSE